MRADDGRPDDGGRRTGPALEAMYQLAKWLIPALDRFPRRQKFLLGDRIQTTALDALERLVEAAFTRDRARLLDRTNVDLDKLRLLLRLSKDLGCLDARRYEHAARAHCASVGACGAGRRPLRVGVAGGRRHSCRPSPMPKARALARRFGSRICTLAPAGSVG